MAFENSLKQLGVNAVNESRRRLTPEERRKELEQNLKAYTNEVLADKPVSILYHYYPDSQDNLFSDPSLKPVFKVEDQFDEQERGGRPKEGFRTLTQTLLHNPNQLVLWYSPPGQASFDSNPENPYCDIEYNYGQLYFQYYNGDKVDALALKITEEQALSYFSPELAERLEQNTDPKQKIIDFLLNPVLINSTPDDFLLQKPPNISFYKSHSLSEIIQNIKETLSGEETNNIDFHLPTNIAFESTERAILQAYLSAIQRYQQSTGKDFINLSGSCGGSTISKDDIQGLLGNEFNFEAPIDKLLDIYSSNNRRFNQTEKKWDYHNGKCVVCSKDPTKVGPCNICADCEKKFD